MKRGDDEILLEKPWYPFREGCQKDLHWILLLSLLGRGLSKSLADKRGIFIVIACTSQERIKHFSLGFTFYGYELSSFIFELGM